MKNEKPEFLEVISDMSRFTGALAGAAVVAFRKLVGCINDLTIAETIKPSANKEQKTGAKSS